MKKKYTAQELRGAFVENGLITENATREGNYKANNKAYNELIKIFKIFEKDINIAKEVLEPILDSLQNESINMHTKIVAATHSLVLDIFINRALAVLQEIADKECFYTFIAQELLAQWHKGELVVYKKKNQQMGTE